MPNVFGRFTEEQLIALPGSLLDLLPPDEHDHVVITNITDDRGKNIVTEIRASDECSAGTVRRVYQAMVRAGVRPAALAMHPQPLKVLTALNFGGAQAKALELHFPVFQHLELSSSVVNLRGNPQPYVAIFGSEGHQQYDDFLQLVSTVNIHAEVEAYWSTGHGRYMTYHPVGAFESWLEKQNN